MGKTSLVVNVHIDGARETLAAFRRLPKDASDELRAASLRLAELAAAKARTAALAEGGPAALMAPTVKAQRDRVPVVQAGGTRRVGRNRVPAWQVLFVSEFGMDARSGWYAADKYALSPGFQHRPHQGRDGIWFFPTVEAMGPTIASEWTAAADRLIWKWTGGGR